MMTHLAVAVRFTGAGDAPGTLQLCWLRVEIEESGQMYDGKDIKVSCTLALGMMWGKRHGRPYVFPVCFLSSTDRTRLSIGAV